MEPDQSAVKRARKPLGDCTNTVSRNLQSSSSSASVIKSANPSLSAALSRVISSTRAKENRSEHKSAVSTRSAARKGNEFDAVSSSGSASAPRVSTAATPSRSRNPPSSQAELQTFEPYSVYTRRKTSAKRKAKEKAVPEPIDFLLTERIPGIGEKTSDADSSIPKTRKLPPKKKQRRVKLEENKSKQTLPQDFVDKQRAYFAEIDAFELEEEEATSTE